MSPVTQTVLPRWRGFNLLEMFSCERHQPFREDDFRWIAEWGFDFVRLPMCYLLWTGDDPFTTSEEGLAEVDRAVEFGHRHGLHVSLNFHKAPGYCISPRWQDPFGLNLWKDERAREVFCFHWEVMSRRYLGIPSEELSFNLVNEPPAPSQDGMTGADHTRVVRAVVAAIRQIDPHRLIIADGVSVATAPSPELADLKVAQSCRAYVPPTLTHYQVPWGKRQELPEPVWPGVLWQGEGWDHRHLEQHYAPWIELARQGVGVHCGEGGAYSRTAHEVVLRWLRDVLEILTQHHIGYALWNFRGAFGVLDSGREDIACENWYGHLLDRKLLSLLQEF